MLSEKDQLNFFKKEEEGEQRSISVGQKEDADLKFSLYIYVKTIPRKFLIFNRKNSGVIHP